jgi:Skp family chaperone for outer membrane proteins
MNGEKGIMKRSVAWMASVLALGAVVYLGSRLGARPIAIAIAGGPGPTRVAVLNLSRVLAKYARQQDLAASLQDLERGRLRRWDAKRIEAQSFGRQGDTDRQMRIEIEMERLREKAQQEAADLAAEQRAAVIKDVREAAARYAKANNIDLVLSFEEAVPKDDEDSAAPVSRQTNATGCAPVYWNESLDISNAVVEELNRNYKREDK